MNIEDMRRELAKALDALRATEQYLARHGEMNAALHCAATVHHSPLHARVTGAIGDIERALQRSGVEVAT